MDPVENDEKKATQTKAKGAAATQTISGYGGNILMMAVAGNASTSSTDSERPMHDTTTQTDVWMAATGDTEKPESQSNLTPYLTRLQSTSSVTRMRESKHKHHHKHHKEEDPTAMPASQSAVKVRHSHHKHRTPEPDKPPTKEKDSNPRLFVNTGSAEPIKDPQDADKPSRWATPKAHHHHKHHSHQKPPTNDQPSNPRLFAPSGHSAPKHRPQGFGVPAAESATEPPGSSGKKNGDVQESVMSSTKSEEPQQSQDGKPTVRVVDVTSTTETETRSLDGQSQHSDGSGAHSMGGTHGHDATSLSWDDNKRRSSLLMNDSLRMKWFRPPTGDAVASVTSKKELNSFLTSNRYMKLKKCRYPYHVFAIYYINFVDRFSFICVKQLIHLYLNKRDKEGVYTATVNWFQMVTSAASMSLSFLSDGVLGSYRAMFVYSVMCVTALTIMLLATFLDDYSCRIVFYLAMLIFLLGIGGFRPAIVTVGADQYLLPEQVPGLNTFFYVSYLFSTMGLLTGKLGIPIFIWNISCINDRCFMYAFILILATHVSAFVLMLTTIGKFASEIPKINFPRKTLHCILQGAYSKWNRTSTHKGWLDAMRPRYGEDVVRNAHTILGLALFFMPMPVYWSLFYKASVRWPIFMQRMSGRVSRHVEVLPSQLVSLISLFEVLLVPALLYMQGLFRKLGMTIPVQRIVWGTFLSCLSYFLYFLVSLAVINTQEEHVIETGTCDVRLYNPTPCDFVLHSTEISLSNISLPSMGCRTYQSIAWDPDLRYDFTLESDACGENFPRNGTFALQHRQPNALYFSEGLVKTSLDVYHSNVSNYPRFRFLAHNRDKRKKLAHMYYHSSVHQYNISSDAWHQDKPGLYHFKRFQNVRLEMGGVYNLLLQITDDGHMQLESCYVVKPYSIHAASMLPSILILSVADVLVMVPCMELAYKHGPLGMKNVAISMFFMTCGFGNLLDLLLDTLGVKENRLTGATLSLMMLISAFLTMVIGAQFKFVHQYEIEDSRFEELPEEAPTDDSEDVSDVDDLSNDDVTIHNILAHNQRVMKLKDAENKTRQQAGDNPEARFNLLRFD